VHSFYYQAMAWDILEIENYTFKYESKTVKGDVSTKSVKLSDKDELWNMFKYVHISEANEQIKQKFSQFKKDNSLM